MEAATMHVPAAIAAAAAAVAGADGGKLPSNLERHLASAVHALCCALHRRRADAVDDYRDVPPLETAQRLCAPAAARDLIALASEPVDAHRPAPACAPASADPRAPTGAPMLAALERAIDARLAERA